MVSIKATNESPPERILLARIGALGDTIMALPVAQAIKATNPSHTIEFLCSTSTAPLLELSPAIDRIYRLSHRNIPYGLSREKQKLSVQLADQQYSQAVLMESAPRFLKVLSATGLSQIRSYVDHPFDEHLHSIENNLRLAGLDAGAINPFEIVLDLSGSSCIGFEEHLKGLPRPVVGIHPGYGPPGRKNNQTAKLRGWPQSSFVKVSQALQGLGASIIITGSASDIPDANFIAATLEPMQTRILAGRTTLPQLAGLLSALDLFLSVDSGPAHLCAAVKTPLIVLWGPGKWVQTRPVSSGAAVELLRKPLPCSPCYDLPAMKSCRRNVCMELIRPTEVFDTCRRLLGLL